MKTIQLLFILLICATINAQETQSNELPYYKIPEYPEKQIQIWSETRPTIQNEISE